MPKTISHGLTTAQPDNPAYDISANEINQHTESYSGLTAGHVMRASAATAADFAAIQDGDLPATIARDSEVTTAVSAHAALAVLDGDPAGGDLSGTYPNPSVVNDSHSHAAATAPGSNTITLATVSLSAAQIKDLVDTAIEVLPALTGRNYYVPIACVAHYRTGAVAFNTNMNLYIGWGSTAAAVVNSGPLNATMTINGVLEDVYSFGEPTGHYESLASLIEGAPLKVANGNADPDPTVGDGTMSLRIYYDIINGAP